MFYQQFGTSCALSVGLAWNIFGHLDWMVEICLWIFWMSLDQSEHSVPDQPRRGCNFSRCILTLVSGRNFPGYPTKEIKIFSVVGLLENFFQNSGIVQNGSRNWERMSFTGFTWLTLKLKCKLPNNPPPTNCTENFNDFPFQTLPFSKMFIVHVLCVCIVLCAGNIINKMNLYYQET